MAVSPAVIKAIITAATDKRVWKIVGIVIAAVLMPFIIVILMICALVSGTENANQSLLDYSFKDVSISQDFTDEQKNVIEDMREWLGELNDIISEKENDGEYSLDGDMVRAVFYCLNFGEELDEDFDYEMFCQCFEDIGIEQLETALQNVSEKFPQYEITESHIEMIEKVYEYLNGGQNGEGS